MQHNPNDRRIEPLGMATIRKEALSNTEKSENEEITGEMLLNQEQKEISFLLKPFLQKVGIACLAGGSDTGKSSFLRQLAIAISVGEQEFLDFELHTNHQSCIYVSTEDLASETAFLLRKQASVYSNKSLSKLRFVFEYENLLSELKKRLKRQAVDAVIIDAFADAYGGDLKDTQKIRTFLRSYQDLAQEYECLIIFLHHTGKRTENNEPSKHNLLAGQGFEAKMRLVMELRPDFYNPYHRHLCIVKGNYVSQEYKKESFVLEFSEDTFTFTNTKEKVSFEGLAKPTTKKSDYEEIKELKQQGMTYEKIAEVKGITKGTVSKIIKKNEKNEEQK
jgi:RecA-family ATPase